MSDLTIILNESSEVSDVVLEETAPDLLVTFGATGAKGDKGDVGTTLHAELTDTDTDGHPADVITVETITGITGDDVQTVLESAAAAISTETSSRQAAIVVEAAARALADATEITARTNAIAAEAASRTVADATETDARTDADDALDARVDQEISDRQTAVTGEATTRANAVTDEANARANAVTAEATARTTAVSAEATSRTNADTALGVRVDQETAARTTAVSGEATSRASADTALGARVDQEITDRGTAVSGEATSRSNADTALGARVDQEITDRTAAVSSEASTRSAADTAEATARANAITSLQSGVNASLAAKADLVGGLIPTSQLPALAINDLFPVASQAAMLALTAQTGDMALRTDTTPNTVYVLAANDPTLLINWVLLAGGAVTSVNGQTGTVVLGAADVGAPTTSSFNSLSTDVTGIGTRLTAIDSGGGSPLAITGLTDLSGVTDQPTARTNLGLGTLATKSTVVSADITDGTIVDADIAAANKDGTTSTPSLRTLGTGAQQAGAGNDARFSDTRTPTDATVTDAKIAGALSPSKITGVAVITTDSRLSDARTPTAHASSHYVGGTDLLDGKVLAPPHHGVFCAAAGDSITLGQVVLSTASTNIASEGSWFEQAMVGSRGQALHSVNDAFAGATTTTMLARFSANVLGKLAPKPNVVFIMGGTNDPASSISLGTTASNLASMVTSTRNAGMLPVLLTVPPNSTANQIPCNTINVWMRDYCARARVDLIDPYPDLVDPATGGMQSAYLADATTHPNAVGAQVIAQKVVDFIEYKFARVYPHLSPYKGSTYNMLTGGNFVDPLVSNVPPGWTKGAGAENTGNTVMSLVAPTSADHVGGAIVGNWLQFAKTGSSTDAIFQQSIFTGWSVGDILSWSGRIKILSRDASTGVDAYIAFINTSGATAAPVFGWGGATVDGGWFIKRTVPANCNEVRPILRVRGMSGATTCVAQYAMPTLMNDSVNNWGQYA